MKIQNRIAIFLFVILVFSGCKKETIEVAEQVLLEYTVTNVSTFNGSDGAIETTIIGGEEPYYYFWSTGADKPDITGLTAGDYTLRVVFGNDGLLEESITVGQPEPEDLQLNFDVNDVSRYGKSDGSVSISVAGGTEPYTVIWNDTDTTMEFKGIPAGTYKVKVIDSSDPYTISDSTFVEVTQPDFICGTDSIADVDGNLYPTVLIENQCWFAQNLKTVHLPDDPATIIEGRFCAGSNCLRKEGAHYTWEAMMNGETSDPEDPYSLVQGICPEGWSIPTRRIFNDLDSILSIPGNYGDALDSGRKMLGEESSSGFDALVAGNWGYNVYINEDVASFWTATGFKYSGAPQTEPATEAYYFYIAEDFPLLSSGHKPKEFGMSVRCVKYIDE
ncbi:MAG: FISUMP domain-containing protein [bacterium]